jgi:hypothetical protein
MVRVRKLKQAFQLLQSCKVHVHDYRDSEAYDAVFSLTTYDGFVAGIADVILSGRAVPFEQQATLHRANLRSGTAWLLENGETFDLSDYPELLNWARIIESVREECLKQM